MIYKESITQHHAEYHKKSKKKSKKLLTIYIGFGILIEQLAEMSKTLINQVVRMSIEKKLTKNLKKC